MLKDLEMFSLLSLSLFFFNFISLFFSIFLVTKLNSRVASSSFNEKLFLILFFILASPLVLIFSNFNFLDSNSELLLNFISYDFFYFCFDTFNLNKNLNVMPFTFNLVGNNTTYVLCDFWNNLLGNLDFISIIFLFMSHIVSFMVIIFSSLYFDLNSIRSDLKILNSFKLTINCVLLMTIMMDTLFLTDNILIIFFLAELSLIPLALLMLKDSTIFWRQKSEICYENKRPLALFYLIFFTIASGGFGFIGILLLYFLFGTFSLSKLQLLDFTNISFVSLPFINFNDVLFSSYSTSALLLSFVCIMFWISVKVPLAPVHVWLPKAHVEGSTESSMLLAGIILKVTVYILIRLTNIPIFLILLENYRPFLLAIAATTAVLGAFGSLLTTDMKRITAYSSVSHMGIILSAGFYIGSISISFTPFIILLLTHTIVSTAMFMMIGCIYKSRFGTFISRNRLSYSGFMFLYPTYFLFGAIIFSNLNIPLTMGFTGELGALITVVKSGLGLGIILSLASFILLLPMLSMIGQVIMGPIRLVDFFKVNVFFANDNISVFYKRLVFNKLVWDNNFLSFYLLKRIYFSSIFLTILGFGIFSYIFVDSLEDSLIFLDLSLTKNSRV